MLRHNFKNIFLSSPFLLLIIFFTASCSEKGKTFKDYSQFIDYQNEEGFLFLGKFGNSWPADVIEVETAKNEISFIYKGTSHKYNGYTGYILKVVRLISDNENETVIVLRSKEKEEIEKDIY